MYVALLLIPIVSDYVSADTGRLMARYCVAFESMKRFLSFKGNEGLTELVKHYSR